MKLSRSSPWLALAFFLTPAAFAQQGAEPAPPADAAPPPSEPAPTHAEPEPEPETAPVAAPAPEPPATDVTVAGTRVNRTAGSAHIINKKQLERFAYDDAHAVLQQVPGVYVRQEDGMGLRPNIGIRGVNPDRSKKVTLMEDGILFGPAPYSAPAAYYFPVMSRMVAVRVIKGPSAVAFGPHTVGGAIDLVTRKIPERTSGAVDLALGEYGYGKAHAHFGTKNEQFGFLVEGLRIWNTGFKELPSGADTGSTRNDWMTKFSYVVDPHARERNEFQLKLSYADEISNETYLGITDAEFRENPYTRYFASELDRMENHRTALVLTHVFEAPERGLKLKTDVYRHDFARVWRKANHFRGASLFDVITAPDDPANADYIAVLRGQTDSATPGESLFVGPNDRTFVSQGIQSVLDLDSRRGAVTQHFQAGIRLHYDEIERRHSESPFQLVGGELVPEDVAPTYTAANRAGTFALALHLTDAISVGGLTFTPGVRAELIGSGNDDELNGSETSGNVAALMPGLGVYYALVEEFGLLAGVHRGFSPPPPGADADNSPEYSVNYEGGARFSRGPARAEVIGFYNDYSNLTDTCTFASSCDVADLDRQFDAGAARIYGVEAFAAHEAPLARGLTLPITLAYTYTRANFASSFESADPIYGDVTDGDEVPYVPRHQFSASAGLEHRRVSIGAAINYVARMREEAGSEPLDQVMATDSQFVVDLSARAQVVAGLSVFAHVRNLFDEAYIVSRRPYGARPNAPRWIQVGGKLEF